LRTGLVLGVTLGTLASGIVLGLNAVGIVHADNAGPIGLTIGTSILLIVIWGIMIGSMFPIILHRLGFDPATISNPLVATLMDVSGLVIYLIIATLIVL